MQNVVTRSVLEAGPLAGTLARIPLEVASPLARQQFDKVFAPTEVFTVDAQSSSEDLACTAELGQKTADTLYLWGTFLQTMFRMRLKPSALLEAATRAPFKRVGSHTPTAQPCCNHPRRRKQ